MASICRSNHQRPDSGDAGRRPLRFCRDRELLRYVSCHGLVSIAHVMAAMGVGRTAAYRRVATCLDAGLLERLELLRSEPSLLRATRAGLRYAGLGELPLATAAPGAVEHWLRCASVALALADEDFGEEDESVQVLAERELALAERVEGRPLASARLASHGRQGLHRPDLAVIAPSGVIAIEVELSIKAKRRLEGILRAWRRAEHVAEVRYYCEPGSTARAVRRAIAVTYAEPKVRLIEGVPR